jgi:U3 small nucleolar ribonucleoprotein protein LCP5
LVGLEGVEEQENERYRNVLNRKKQKSEIYEGGNKRARDDDDDNEDNFNGLFDGERKAKNKFSAARSKKKGGKPKKRRS